jgi:hypothetical protein
MPAVNMKTTPSLKLMNALPLQIVDIPGIPSNAK